MRRLPAALVAAVAILLAVAPSALAGPHRGACLPGHPSGPKCWIWTGKVKFVADGDTVFADIDGDGTSRQAHIRLTGFNATELTHYAHKPSERRGECHAVEATALMEKMIKRSHWRVRLLAQHRNARSGKRIRRSLQVRMGGRWQDTGPTMLRDGDALWMPNNSEWAWTSEYRLIAENAAARGVGLYNTASCGPGPYAGARLRVRVNWDADGNDFQNIDGEWIEVSNSESHPISLRGWWVRVSDARRYKLPSWTTVPANGRIRLHMGHGTSRGANLYWGFSHPVFSPVGDGGYLFDPRGNLRAWMIYPCRVNCTDPLRGRVRLSASYHGLPEYATIRNTSDAPIDLDGYALELPFRRYELGSNSILDPGEALRVDVQGDPADDTRLHRYYGYNGYLLGDGGGSVTLQSYTDIRVACYSWGGASCR
jgi:endonuclease YncB( thermonuclease family)